ncbi:MAG: hypothetical protein GX558_09005 [Clostridiales bacterium]|nr:hypothetical protein [Clostridiales bacterium]
MQPRERLLRALRGEPVDRCPWSPFLAYWWEAQPESVRAQGQLAFLEAVGADPLLRGFGATWAIEYVGVDRRVSVRGGHRQEALETPVGSLALGYRYSQSGDTWFLCDHPVREIEDLKVLSWIYEHAVLRYDSAADEERRRIGERALILPLIGADMKTCFQSMVEKWAGTESLTYLLADDPEEVEACLAVMRAVSDRTAEMAAQSECEAFIFWEDSSTTNVSPGMFQKYTAAEVTCWGNVLHAAGKLLVHHACGHLRALLPLMAGLPIDAVESISPPPTGNIDVAEAFRLLPGHIGLIGGIEPVFFQNCSGEELDARVDQLLAISASRRYVLANSDSCPPGVDPSKFSRVSARVRRGA